MTEEENSIVLSTPPMVDQASLTAESNDLTSRIIAEKDSDKLEDLTNLFMLNQKKKTIARINKLSNLLELIDDEAIIRFETAPELFDNDQLLKYINSTQQNISNAKQDITQTPLIQINNQKNEININDSGLNHESRQRVLDAVMAIIRGASDNTIVDVEGEEIK